MRLRDEYEPPVRLRIIKAHVVVYREENGGALIIRYSMAGRISQEN